MTQNSKAYNRVQKQKSKCIICVSASCSFKICGLFLRTAQTLETFRNLLRESGSWERWLGILVFLFTYLPIFPLKYLQHEHCMEPSLVCIAHLLETTVSCSGCHHTLTLIKSRTGLPTCQPPATGLWISTKQERTPQKLKATVKQKSSFWFMRLITCMHPNTWKLPRADVLSAVTQH